MFAVDLYLYVNTFYILISIYKRAKLIYSSSYFLVSISFHHEFRLYTKYNYMYFNYTILYKTKHSKDTKRNAFLFS